MRPFNNKSHSNVIGELNKSIKNENDDQCNSRYNLSFNDDKRNNITLSNDKLLTIFESRYSRMDQVKFVEDSI